MKGEAHYQQMGSTAVIVHDAALLAAVFYSPIFWGGFGTAGQAFAAALIGLAVVAALVAHWTQGRGVALIANPVHLPALAFLGISTLSALWSVSKHASAIELSRLTTGALLFGLVASRASLPRSPAKPVAASFACFALMVPFVRVLGEAGLTLDILTIVSAGLVCALILAAKGEANLARWLWQALVVVSAFVIAAAGLREKIFVSLVLHNPTWRIFSTFFNPNPLGGFFAMILPLAASTALSTGLRWQRAMWGFAALVLLLALLPTYAKGAMVALMVAVGVYVVLAARVSSRPRRNLGIVFGALAVATIAVASALWFSPPLRTRVVGVLGPASASNMFRLLTWKGTANMAAAHPWLGIGPGAFKYAYMKYAIAGYVEAAHENFLQIAAEQGIFGAVVFLWLMGAVLFTGWRALARAQDFRGRILAIGGISSIIVLLVHSLFDYDWYIGAINLTFWLLAGLLAHLSHGGEHGPAVVKDAEHARGYRRGRGRAASRGIRAKRPMRDVVVALLLFAIICKSVALSARNALAQRALNAGNSAVGRAQAAWQQGDTVRKEEEAEKALRHYQTGVAYDPGWAAAWERYGLLEGGEDGTRALKKAGSLEPTHFQWRLSLALHYERQGKLREAIACYQEALDRFRNNTRALRRMAEAYQKLGDGESALRVYQHMVEIEHSAYNQYRALDIDVDTEYAYAHYHLGRAALRGYRLGQFGDGLTAASFEFQEALRVIADYQERGRRIDELFRQVGRPREPREEGMRILQAMVRWRMADVAEHLADPAAAEDNRKLALSLLPDVARAAAIEDGAQPE